ncbi:MAG: ABC transporter permease [Sphaerochaetaceae bacterium]
MLNFILTHGPAILQKTLEHISLSLTAVLIACLIGIPVGFLIVGHKKLSQIVLGIANIIQTIPSLAMFAFALPIFGIGIKPAIFALFLYALLPILKNTLLGIRNVDPAIIKAAKGMGMSRFEIMFMVEVPLSISIIMGGVRIATVTSIGVTTIATLIAAGGLGDFIYQGLSTFNQPMILTGAILSAGLALIADFLLGLVEKRLTSDGLKSDTSKKHKKKKNTNKEVLTIKD